MTPVRTCRLEASELHSEQVEAPVGQSTEQAPVVMEHGLEKLGPSWAAKALRGSEGWKGRLQRLTR